MNAKSVNVDKLVEKALKGLDARSAKIISGRYGLSGGSSKTLAELGLSYGLTRERVRQIEANAIASLIKALKEDAELEYLAGFIDGYLEGMGDVRRHDLLTPDLYSLFGASGSTKRFANELRLLADIMESPQLVEGDDEWHDAWHRNEKSYKMAKKIAEAMLQNNSGDFNSFLHDTADKYNLGEFVVINYLSLSKHFKIGPYGDLGPDHWVSVDPRTVKDKSYLVLMKAKEPLHFKEVASRVNTLSDKKVHHQTVHNELIKDPRFVLVRRGTYGLKDYSRS